ncbi:MarR family transcriptional regulator [Micromonospora sp. HM134]|uniref:MarR family winged helix-turn-helix transcriptional regulator n=1 Tax=Micromonospora sp. HM134 TaxID=2583243 RepID=UPI00119879FC|nr:MarR family transcriptional regulator [Micromonospora sp. HM134]QDY06416.1 MarR family transcriptional regulator [Micromonospora sp. HM134]
MSTDADPVLDELSNLVFEMTRRLRDDFNESAAELSLPPTQALALVYLSTPAPMRELADRLSCEPSNVTAIVDGLESRGLVTRQPDPSDRRVKHVTLTGEGERHRAELGSRNRAKVAAVFNLSAPDRSQLRDLLSRALDDSS